MRFLGRSQPLQHIPTGRRPRHDMSMPCDIPCLIFIYRYMSNVLKPLSARDSPSTVHPLIICSRILPRAHTQINPFYNFRRTTEILLEDTICRDVCVAGPWKLKSPSISVSIHMVSQSLIPFTKLPFRSDVIGPKLAGCIRGVISAAISGQL
jgi:hypothetical protein